ncbi:helix-turn-helix domain-containing protein [Winogradskya humida]|uniref:HTH cro/C1-type domain-containing protein n=1 Tax=Winogradskya humida TaxID=113566 RepID=A0ABQ4A149_9ACTN|nr:helix-turn-helix transcriptional regulator [Actinoplanes humidus]GIE24553.1 hypothetical protein Ahu01nite_076550 [Actinoplanes humidus]
MRTSGYGGEDETAVEQPHFGRRLKAIRLKQGLHQSDLAGAGMSTGYLSRLESGDRPPTPRAIAYLAAKLGVDAAFLTQRPRGSLSEILAATASAPRSADSIAALSRAVHEDTFDDPGARWHALWLLSRRSSQQGDHEVERTLLLELVALSEGLGTPELRARAHLQHARCMRALGDMRAALPAAELAVAITRESGLSAADTMGALMVLISVEAESGSLDTATRHAQILEQEFLAGALPSQAAEILWVAAMVRVRKGDFPSAMRRLESAIDRLDSTEDLGLWTRLRAAAAAAAMQSATPHLEAARHWIAEAEMAVSLIGTALQIQEIRSLQAHLAFHENRWDDARQLCDTVLNDDQLRLSYRDRVRLQILDGRLMIMDGWVGAGIKNLENLGRQAAETQNFDLAAQVWHSLAMTLAAIHAPPP